MLSEFEEEQNKFMKMQQRRQGLIYLYKNVYGNLRNVRLTRAQFSCGSCGTATFVISRNFSQLFQFPATSRNF